MTPLISSLLLLHFGPPDQASARKELVVQVGSQNRTYILHTPSQLAQKKPLPVVIALHGGMGTGASMEAKTGFSTLADREGFLVAYPDGIAGPGGKGSWNVGWVDSYSSRQKTDDVAFLKKLIEVVIEKHHADPQRVYLTGGSNGGMMTHVMAAKYPKLCAAVAVVVASVPLDYEPPKSPVPILFINGDADEEIPFDGGMSRNALVKARQQKPFTPISELVAKWAKANGAVDKPVVSREGSVVTNTYAATKSGAETVFIRLEGTGHGWPARDFVATNAVWEFFKRH
jgi:polyhydroxybutyrate depolymerase